MKHARFDQQDIPELPALDPGIRLLESDSRPTGAIHALVLDHLLLNDGTVRWVDSRGHATTNPLARLAPSPRTLERIYVARGFTPYQHTTLVDRLLETIDEETTLLVAPAFDALYQGGDCHEEEGERLLLRSLATLRTVAREHDLPVLMTRTAHNAFTAPLETAATDQIQYEQTELGPRFSGSEFETLVYPVGNGFVQTTLTYWKRILEARQPLYQTSSSVTREVTVHGSY